MVFSSLIFLFFFLPVSLLAYYIMPNVKLKNLAFLGLSMAFYFYGEPKKICVILVSILLNYIFGLLMSSKRKNLYLLMCVVSNLSILGYFKYMNFFIETSNSLLNSSFNQTSIIMPIGISFFTFQSLSYVIDVYRKEVPAQKNIINLALYVSMFPQLIAGPIVRYKDINDSLESRKVTTTNFSNGIDRFIYGLSKKVLLSNVFAVIADYVFALQLDNLSFTMAWFGAISYTLQIYYDFSGYSDMAIGLGKMFGFEFMENFNYPYISKSVTEFWRRWHISLSTWFRDYVYIPLGGNRVSKNRHILNIFIIWTLTGFWHGANFTFLAWGFYYAVLLVIEKHIKIKAPNFIKHITTMILVVFGWVLFRSDSINQAIKYIKVMLIPEFSVDMKMIEFIMTYKYEMVIGLLLVTPIYKKLKLNKYITTCIVGVLLILCVLSLITNSYNPFIYFRF